MEDEKEGQSSSLEKKKKHRWIKDFRQKNRRIRRLHFQPQKDWLIPARVCFGHWNPQVEVTEKEDSCSLWKYCILPTGSSVSPSMLAHEGHMITRVAFCAKNICSWGNAGQIQKWDTWQDNWPRPSKESMRKFQLGHVLHFNKGSWLILIDVIILDYVAESSLGDTWNKGDQSWRLCRTLGLVNNKFTRHTYTTPPRKRGRDNAFRQNVHKRWI